MLIQIPAEVYENFSIQLSFADSPHKRMNACFERCTFDILGLKGPHTFVQLGVEEEQNESHHHSMLHSSQPSHPHPESHSSHHQRVRVINLKFRRENQNKDELNCVDKEWVPLGHAVECPASTFYKEEYRRRLNLPKEIGLLVAGVVILSATTAVESITL
jgi:hypothetical protein